MEFAPHLNLERNFTVAVCVCGRASSKPKTELLIFILYSHNNSLEIPYSLNFKRDMIPNITLI